MSESDRFAGAVLSFVQRELIGDSGPLVDLDTYLFDEGMIDSLKILQLIAFVETQTGRAIPDSEIVMKNFRSVRAIAEHFGARQNERVSSPW